MSLAAVCLAGAGLAQTPVAPVAEDWTVVPGVRVGSIQADTRPADLVARFGKDNVAEAKVGLDDGPTADGMTVFPRDPDRRLHVVWRDARRTRVRLVRIEGSRWQAPAGVAVGTTLAALERINAGDFEVSGFGAKAGGTVVSWKGGDLSGLARGGLSVRLSPTARAKVPDADFAKVAGDKPVPSRDPVFRSVEPTVSLLVLTMPGPALYRVKGPGQAVPMLAEPGEGAKVVGRLPAQAAGAEATGATRQVGQTTWRELKVGQTSGWVPDSLIEPVATGATPATPATDAKGQPTRT
jgi:hypothetical protein